MVAEVAGVGFAIEEIEERDETLELREGVKSGLTGFARDGVEHVLYVEEKEGAGRGGRRCDKVVCMKRVVDEEIHAAFDCNALLTGRQEDVGEDWVENGRGGR